MGIRPENVNNSGQSEQAGELKPFRKYSLFFRAPDGSLDKKLSTVAVLLGREPVGGHLKFFNLRDEVPFVIPSQLVECGVVKAIDLSAPETWVPHRYIAE